MAVADNSVEVEAVAVSVVTDCLIGSECNEDGFDEENPLTVVATSETITMNINNNHGIVTLLMLLLLLRRELLFLESIVISMSSYSRSRSRSRSRSSLYLVFVSRVESSRVVCFVQSFVHADDLLCM